MSREPALRRTSACPYDRGAWRIREARASLGALDGSEPYRTRIYMAFLIYVLSPLGRRCSRSHSVARRVACGFFCYNERQLHHISLLLPCPMFQTFRRRRSPERASAPGGGTRIPIELSGPTRARKSRSLRAVRAYSGLSWRKVVVKALDRAPSLEDR